MVKQETEDFNIQATTRVVDQDILPSASEAYLRSKIGTALLLRNAIEGACERGEFAVIFQSTDCETVESLLIDKKYKYTKTRLAIPYEWYEFYISW